MKYCSLCAALLEQKVPANDERSRHVCTVCDHVHYQNPRVVVGTVPTWEDSILFCRRAIEPRTGFWTLPAGFLELGESTRDGAIREAHEEARAQLEITALLAVYDLTHIGQVQLFYSASLVVPDVEPGPESLEVRLFRWEEIPWEEIAFPSVHWVLNYHRDVRGVKHPPPHTNPG